MRDASAVTWRLDCSAVGAVAGDVVLKGGPADEGASCESWHESGDTASPISSPKPVVCDQYDTAFGANGKWQAIPTITGPDSTARGPAAFAPGLVISATPTEPDRKKPD
jgi:hypothetical protein